MSQIRQNPEDKNYAVTWLEPVTHLRRNLFARIVNGLTFIIFAKMLDFRCQNNSSYTTVMMWSILLLEQEKPINKMKQ